MEPAVHPVSLLVAVVVATVIAVGAWYAFRRRAP